jgi:hypothetical protein
MCSQTPEGSTPCLTHPPQHPRDTVGTQATHLSPPSTVTCACFSGASREYSGSTCRGREASSCSPAGKERPLAPWLG